MNISFLTPLHCRWPGGDREWATNCYSACFTNQASRTRSTMYAKRFIFTPLFFPLLLLLLLLSSFSFLRFSSYFEPSKLTLHLSLSRTIFASKVSRSSHLGTSILVGIVVVGDLHADSKLTAPTRFSSN